MQAAVGRKLTGSGVVTPAGKPGWLLGYVLVGGTTISSVEFKDGGASGTTKWHDSIKAQTVAGDASVQCMFSAPIPFSTDIYAVLAGTGAWVNILYKEGI